MSRLPVPDYVSYICAVLRAAGHKAYAVGGGVRDALLGRVPKDWDVATSAPPHEVQRLFPKTVPTGVEFGTVTVLVENDGQAAERRSHSGESRAGRVGTGATADGALHAVEVTTFRGESGYFDGRHPDSVQFIGSIEDDLVRRDFTVNAIAYDPETHVIVDPHGGQADLMQRLIRAVGDPDQRFYEDGLRVLRAVRIAVELGFSIEPATARAMRRHGARLLQVSRERIGQEWRRMLLAPDAGRGLAMLDELALLSFVLPTAPSRAPTAAAVVRTVAALDRARAADLVVKTSLVLHGLGDPDQHEAWLRKLVYPKQAARAALHVSGALRSFSPDAVGDDAALRRFLHGLGRPHITAFFDAWAAWRSGEQARRLRERALRIASRGDALTAGELAVNGHDVKSIWPGITGPEVGVVLNRLLDHVLTHPGDNTRARLEELLRRWREQAGVASEAADVDQ